MSNNLSESQSLRLDDFRNRRTRGELLTPDTYYLLQGLAELGDVVANLNVKLQELIDVTREVSTDPYAGRYIKTSTGGFLKTSTGGFVLQPT